MATKIGLEGELFRGAAGATANVLVGNAKDVTLNLEAGEADITTRKANGWRMSKATLKEASLEFTINYDPEDEDTKAFMVAFLEGTPLALFFGDGSGNGLDADFSITGFNMEQPLEEAQTVSVTAKPTDIGGENSRAPKWIDDGMGPKGSTSASQTPGA